MSDLMQAAAAVRANPTYLGWGESDAKCAAIDRIRRAIVCYEGIYGARPREVRCHPLDAVEAGPALGEVLVIGDGRARNVYLVGPIPDGAGR